MSMSTPWQMGDQPPTIPPIEVQIRPGEDPDPSGHPPAVAYRAEVTVGGVAVFGRDFLVAPMAPQGFSDHMMREETWHAFGLRLREVLGIPAGD